MSGTFAGGRVCFTARTATPIAVVERTAAVAAVLVSRNPSGMCKVSLQPRFGLKPVKIFGILSIHAIIM
jgi:hypothetical protein